MHLPAALFLFPVLVLTGCQMTAGSTCDALDAAHDVFLAEIAADPDAYDKATIRNERLAYAASKIACTSYVRTNPKVN